MSRSDVSLPAQVPILSRGKHRNPRKGACFMEFASYLAGERWSDHPTCTHSLLGAVARNVNDYTSDAGRFRLVELIPSVIGLTSTDLRVDARIALHCARVALPVVAAERQRVMAVSLIMCERVLAELDGRAPGSLAEPSRRALAQVPDAEQWAWRFTRDMRTSSTGFRRHAAPSIVSYAIEGIARACLPHPDDVLRDVLVGAIAECAACVRRDAAATTAAERIPERAGRR